MVNELLQELNKNIPIGVSICNATGEIQKIHPYFNEIFDNDSINTVYDEKKLTELFLSSKNYISFYIKTNLGNKYYRIDKNKIDDLFIFILSDITYIANKSNVYKLSFESNDNNILPILWINSKGHIIYYNKSINNYINQKDLKSRKVYRLASDIKKSDWTKLWNELLINSTKEFEYKFYNKILDKIHILKIIVKYIKIYELEYCYMVISDITELIDTNTKLEREKEKGIDSERLKDTFLLNMSHEIRTPMNSIVGFSTLIHNNINSSLKEYSNIVIQNVDYLLSLIENITTISELDSNQISAKYDYFDVLESIENIQFSYNLKLSKLNKDISIIIDNKIHYEIKSDIYIINECLNILVENAIKFSNDGIINIGFDVVEDLITFYVKDNGIGIENKYHDIIFDRFRQINKTKNGSGLGLSIFKSYMKILGGKCNINSILHTGTTISFTLNVNGINNSSSSSSSKLEYIKLNNIKILVAEDININQTLIYDMLTPYGVDIIKAMNGKECVEKFYEINDIDIILMDLDMPIIDGYDATQMIRDKDKNIPIIAQTAYSHKENREKAKRIGIDDFITKPINKDILIRTIIKKLNK